MVKAVGDTRNVWFRDTRVVRAEKRLTLSQPIAFDLLVIGLGCRQTEVQWSVDYLCDHSLQQEVSGGTVTTTAIHRRACSVNSKAPQRP